MLHVAGLEIELLQAQRDGPLHLVWTHALKEGGHGHDRNLDLREDVHHHVLVGHHAQEHDHQADRHHRIRILKRGSDHATPS